MSSQNYNYLIQNSSGNSTNSMREIEHLGQMPCPLEGQLIGASSSVSLNQQENCDRDSLTCFINEVTNTISSNSNPTPSTSSTLLSSGVTSLIINLDSSSSGNVHRDQLSSSVSGNYPKNSYNTLQDADGVYLRIIEQPTNRIRYRYKSEKGSHGGLTGENSSQTKKTYPTLKLENYHQSNQVFVKASLYTNERHPKIHVHKLMGKNCNDDGVCTVPLSENMTATFQNLGILFVGKKEVPDILYQRKLDETRILNAMVNNNNSGQLSENEKRRVREEAERESKDINLNSVKICFEAFIMENDMNFPICVPIFSRPIANQKSPDSGELKIVRMDKYSGHASGDEEVYLLCEKVNKKEIKVRFFETDNEGNQFWEAFGSFTEADVHHQVAIVFRTPPYRDQNIDRPVPVYLQLYRPRDGEFSEPRAFTYKPKEFDGDGVERKRKKVNHYNSDVNENKDERNRNFGLLIGFSGGQISDGGNNNSLTGHYGQTRAVQKLCNHWNRNGNRNIPNFFKS